MKKKGKINLFDVLVILVLVAVVAFVGMKLLGDNTETLGSENAVSQPNIRFTVVCEDMDSLLAESVLESLQGADRTVGGNVVAMTRLFNSNKLVDAQVVDAVYEEGRLMLTVEGKAVLSSGSYSVGTQEVRLGIEFLVKTLGIEVTGNVWAMEILNG